MPGTQPVDTKSMKYFITSRNSSYVRVPPTFLAAEQSVYGIRRAPGFDMKLVQEHAPRFTERLHVCVAVVVAKTPQVMQYFIFLLVIMHKMAFWQLSLVINGLIHKIGRCTAAARRIQSGGCSPA